MTGQGGVLWLPWDLIKTSPSSSPPLFRRGSVSGFRPCYWLNDRFTHKNSSLLIGCFIHASILLVDVILINLMRGCWSVSILGFLLVDSMSSWKGLSTASDRHLALFTCWRFLLWDFIISGCWLCSGSPVTNGWNEHSTKTLLKTNGGANLPSKISSKPLIYG